MTPTLESPLVETDWLEANLEDPTLRILDCTVNLQRSDGETRVESGREAWAAEHIPRSVYADLAGEFSDRSSKLRFMMPPVGQFAQAMGRIGVGDGTSVVLYDRAGHMWAARIWWMLRAAGFDDAAVLNGGWMKWTAEGRPVANATDAKSSALFLRRAATTPSATPAVALRARASRPSVAEMRMPSPSTSDTGRLLLRKETPRSPCARPSA